MVYFLITRRDKQIKRRKLTWERSLSEPHVFKKVIMLKWVERKTEQIADNKLINRYRWKEGGGRIRGIE